MAVCISRWELGSQRIYLLPHCSPILIHLWINSFGNHNLIIPADYGRFVCESKLLCDKRKVKTKTKARNVADLAKVLLQIQLRLVQTHFVWAVYYPCQNCMKRISGPNEVNINIEMISSVRLNDEKMNDYFHKMISMGRRGSLSHAAIIKNIRSGLQHSNLHNPISGSWF